MELVREVIACDLEKFGRRHDQFKEDPVSELKFGFELIKNNQTYRERYEKELNILIYGTEVVWGEAIETLENLVNHAFGDD